MDSFLKSSKFNELKKSFSSAHNLRSNSSQLSYNLRSATKNISRKGNSIYSKYYNRTYGPSEVNPQPSRNVYPRVVLRRINEADKFSNFNGNTSAFKEGENLEHCSNDIVYNIPTRENVEPSFHLQYSNTSPVKSSSDVERSVYHRPQVQNVQIPAVSQVERDRDGFAIPTGTAICNPRQRIVETNEEEEEEDRLLKATMSELIDLVTPVKAFYFLKRYEEWLQEKRKKVPLFNGHGLDKEKNLQIINWLLSNPYEAHVGNREMIEDYVSVSSRNTVGHQQQPNLWQRYKEANTAPQVAVFLLKNWTVIKGIKPMDLMASGDLRDVKDQTLIEEGHVTSGILTADSTIIKTSCCVYHLIGDFCDTNNNVPEDIKKYFANGKFPNQWKQVVRKWNLIRQKESMLRFNNQSDNGYGDNYEMKNSVVNKKRKASTSQEEQKQVELKRRRSHLVPDQSMQQTPVSSRKHSNFSMVTRSYLRMRQGRGDYSQSRRSEAYNKLKARIKTPMPRIRGAQVISDDDSNSF